VLTTLKEGKPGVCTPKVSLKGDFVLDLEAAIAYGHFLTLELEGPGGKLPVQVTRDGYVTLGTLAQKAPVGWRHDVQNRIRIVRLGDRFQVLLNDHLTSASVLDAPREFTQIHLIQAPGGVRTYAIKAAVRKE
jgi:hypothetical protein